LILLGIENDIADAGTGYVRAMALTVIPMLAVGVLRTRLTAIERPGMMLRITLCAVPVNALFNYVFMYGAFGLPELGVTGAGASSLLVGVLTLAALMREAHRVGDSGSGGVQPEHIAAIFRIGVPIGIATLAEVGIYLGPRSMPPRCPPRTRPPMPSRSGWRESAMLSISACSRPR
jgi:MATE family multidrug resistance protein